jgi:hypothetical protein
MVLKSPELSAWVIPSFHYDLRLCEDISPPHLIREYLIEKIGYLSFPPLNGLLPRIPRLNRNKLSLLLLPLPFPLLLLLPAPRLLKLLRKRIRRMPPLHPRIPLILQDTLLVPCKLPRRPRITKLATLIQLIDPPNLFIFLPLPFFLGGGPALGFADGPGLAADFGYPFGLGLGLDDFCAGGTGCVFGYALAAEEGFVRGNGDIGWESDLLELGVEVIGWGFEEDGLRGIQDLSDKVGSYKS